MLRNESALATVVELCLILNEVLSLNAQEFRCQILFVSMIPVFLNEVLSLNAQE